MKTKSTKAKYEYEKSTKAKYEKSTDPNTKYEKSTNWSLGIREYKKSTEKIRKLHEQ